MAKIKITENGLKKLIRESVLTVLNEATLQADDTYEFQQLLDILKWRGKVSNRDMQRAAEMGPLTPDKWAQITKTAYPQLSKRITEYTIDNNATAAGAANALANGGYMRTGGTNVNAGAVPKSFTELAQLIRDEFTNRPNSTWSFDFDQNATTNNGVFNQSTGPFHTFNNPKGKQTAKNLILQKIRQAAPSLKITNPQQANNVTTGLTNWVNRAPGYEGTPIKTLNSWFQALDQVLKTSYNDTAVVAGFQRAMNLFGTRLGVDGVIGNQTRGALQQAGYKDIFAFKADAEAVQRALGVQPVDGKVGNITLKAMQQNGITSLEAFKSVARRANGTNVASAVGGPQNQPMGPSQISQPAQPAGTLAESKLNKIVKESINKVLREMEEEGFWNDKVKPAAQKAGKAVKKAGKTVAKTVGKGVKAYGNAMKTNTPSVNDPAQNYLNK